MLHVDQHLKHTSEKLAKPKPSFLQLSSPSCCLLWQLVIARTDGITWPQGVLPSTIHSTLQSCSVLLFLLHVASKPSSTIFFWVICLCSFFVSLLPPTSNSGAASHPNFSPTAAGGAIWMHLPRSFISYRDFAESHSDELSINSTFWRTTIQTSSERFKQCSKPIIGWFIGIPRSWITDDDDDDDVVNPQFPVESPGKRTLVQALSVQR